MFCPPERGENLRALMSGLSMVLADNRGIPITRLAYYHKVCAWDSIY